MPWLAKYVGRRLLVLAAVLLSVSVAIFMLLQLAPGSTERLLVGNRPATPQLLADLRAKYALDEPLLVQYLHWLGDAVQLRFGTSTVTGQEVLSLLVDRAGVTLMLVLYGFVLAMLIGVPLGVWSGLRQGSRLDRSIVGASLVGVSAPLQVTGVVLLYVFVVELGWFPAYGVGEGFSELLYHLTLPAISLALWTAAVVVKLTRAAVGEVARQDFILFARARGVGSLRLLLNHVMRNAMVPILTAAAAVLTVLITGTFLAEAVFALPGLGMLLVDSVEAKDIAVLQGTALLLATLVLVVNLAADILYTLVDPRIRYAKGSA